MSEHLDGTFVKDFSKRELALTLFSALQFLQDGSGFADIQRQIKTDDDELEDLRGKLTEFFENI